MRRYISEKEPRLVDVTQLRWENFTHIGCGWLRINVGQEKWALEKMSGEFENFLVCNYGESRDKQEMSKACFSEVDDSTIVPQVSDSKFSIEMRDGPPAVSSMSMDPVSKDHEHLLDPALAMEFSIAGIWISAVRIIS